MWFVRCEGWEWGPSCREVVLWLIRGRSLLHWGSGRVGCRGREEGYGWTLCGRLLGHLADHIWPLNVVYILNVSVVRKVAPSHLRDHILSRDIVGLGLWPILVLLIYSNVRHQTRDSTNKLVPLRIFWKATPLLGPPSDNYRLWARPLGAFLRPPCGWTVCILVVELEEGIVEGRRRRGGLWFGSLGGRCCESAMTGRQDARLRGCWEILMLSCFRCWLGIPRGRCVTMTC